MAPRATVGEPRAPCLEEGGRVPQVPQTEALGAWLGRGCRGAGEGLGLLALCHPRGLPPRPDLTGKAGDTKTFP